MKKKELATRRLNCVCTYYVIYSEKLFDFFFQHSSRHLTFLLTFETSILHQIFIKNDGDLRKLHTDINVTREDRGAE